MKFILFLFAALLMAQSAWTQVYQPGFRTLGLWQDEPRMRLDVNIWYPSLRQAKALSFPPWNIEAALNAKPAEGRFPVLLLSHATPADRFAYHELAAFLAREGFVIIAPNHSRDYMGNMDDLFLWAQLATRIRELEKSIEIAASEKDLAPIIDRNRMGVIGFGSGATAALLMGGASPNCNAWPGYANHASRNDVYLSSWAVNRINQLCGALPINQNFAYREIKAIAAIAPGFGMLFDQTSFAHFYPPLLLVNCGKDQFNVPALHSLRLARLLGKKAKILDLPQADAGALLSACAPALIRELPGLCESVPPQTRKEIHALLADALLTFFRHYLGITANLPVIPAPPAQAD